jgi:hypothetical protein
MNSAKQDRKSQSIPEVKTNPRSMQQFNKSHVLMGAESCCCEKNGRLRIKTGQCNRNY